MGTLRGSEHNSGVFAIQCTPAYIMLLNSILVLGMCMHRYDVFVDQQSINTGAEQPLSPNSFFHCQALSVQSFPQTVRSQCLDHFQNVRNIRERLPERYTTQVVEMLICETASYLFHLPNGDGKMNLSNSDSTTTYWRSDCIKLCYRCFVLFCFSFWGIDI